MKCEVEYNGYSMNKCGYIEATMKNTLYGNDEKYRGRATSAERLLPPLQLIVFDQTWPRLDQRGELVT